MSYVSKMNLKKERILQLIKDLQYSFYSDESNWNTDFTVANGIKYAKDNALDEFEELFDITTVEDKQFCLLKVENKSESIYKNINKMMIDTYRMEIINIDKGDVINLDDNPFIFDKLNKTMKYKTTLLVETQYEIIDTVYARWYYGNYIVSNGQGFSPFNNTVIRLAKNVLWQKYKRLIRDYPTVSFEFKLVKKNSVNVLILTGAVDIISERRYTNSLLKNIGKTYDIPTRKTVDEEKNSEYVYFDYIGKRYKTKNEHYKEILKSKKKIL